MTVQLITAEPVVLSDSQWVNFRTQVGRLAPGTPWMAAVDDNGRVYVRSTRDLPATLIELWKKEPAMMIPDSAEYRPRTREVGLDIL